MKGNARFILSYEQLPHRTTTMIELRPLKNLLGEGSDLAKSPWFIQTFDESRLSWLRELFPEAGKCFTRFQRKHRIPSVSHLIYKKLALKPASAACRTVHARSTRSFCGQKRLSLAKKKPEADKEPRANPSGTPSSDLFASFPPRVP